MRDREIYFESFELLFQQTRGISKTKIIYISSYTFRETERFFEVKTLDKTENADNGGLDNNKNFQTSKI